MSEENKEKKEKKEESRSEAPPLSQKERDKTEIPASPESSGIAERIGEEKAPEQEEKPKEEKAKEEQKTEPKEEKPKEEEPKEKEPKEEPKEEKPKEEKPKDGSRSEAETPASPESSGKAERIGEKKAPKQVEKPKPTNCTQCNKVLKHRMWYYRNGKFYCNKRCWKKSTEKVA